MKVNLANADHTYFLQEELYTLILIGLVHRQETGLALPLHNLFSFRREGVVSIAASFRIAPIGTDFQSQLDGFAYLNPLRSADYRLLQNTAMQNSFPLPLLYDNLRVGVGQEMVWSVYNRQQVRVLSNQLEQNLPDVVRRGSANQQEYKSPTFEALHPEFQIRYSLKTLLATQSPANGVKISPPFHGEVLE